MSNLSVFARKSLKLLVFLLPALALLFVFRDLFLGFFFNNGDVQGELLPYLEYGGQNGPLVAQSLLFGFPLYVSIGAVQLFPLYHFAFSFLSGTTAYTALDLGYLMLAYLCAYGYARAIGLNKLPAVLTGMTFVFSGQVMLWSSSLINSAYYFLLPLSLLLVERALATKSVVRRFGYLTLLGFFLGIGWLSAHVQFVVYIHTFLFVYVSFRIWGRIRVSVRDGVKWLGGIVMYPYLISAAVGSPVILAVLTFQPESVRSAGVSLKAFFTGSFLPWDAVHYLLPFWHVDFLPVSSPNLYIGIIPLLLVVSMVIMSWRRYQLPSLAWFYLGVLGFCLLASIDYSPLGAFLHFLPLFAAFREAPRIMFLGGFAESILAGIAYDLLLSSHKDIEAVLGYMFRVVRLGILYVLIPFFAVASAIKVLFFNRLVSYADNYFSRHIYVHTTQLPLEHYLMLIRTYMHQAVDQFSLLDTQVGILLVSLTLALIWHHYRTRVSPYTFGIIGIMLVAFNFASVYQYQNSFVSLIDLNRTPHTASYIRSVQKGNFSPFRIFPLFPGMSIFNATVACPDSGLTGNLILGQEMLRANVNMNYNIDSIDGYENFMPAYVSNALGYVGADGSLNPERLTLQHIPLSEKISIVMGRKNVLRAMNVKYVVSMYPLSDPSFVNVYTEEVEPCQSLVYIYKLSGSWPRYFVTNRVIAATSTQMDPVVALNQLNSESKPVALVNSATPVATTTNAHTMSFVHEVIPVIGHDTLVFTNVSCNAQCALVIGNAFLSGYRAYVDGIQVPIARTNYLFMSVPLATGTHTVRIQYPNPLPW